MFSSFRSLLKFGLPRHSFSTVATPRSQAHYSPSNTSKVSPRTLFFFGTPIAITFSLGVWQVRRLKRKLHLIEAREASLSEPPLEASALLASSEDYDHRRVHISGRFRHDREMLVGPRSAPKDLPMPVLQWGGSSGLQVITPFELDGGEGVILVNRGWVPQRLEAPLKRGVAAVTPHAFMIGLDEKNGIQDYNDGREVSERCCFTAVVRRCEEKNRFTPTNIPEKGEWYYLDAEAMIHSAGVEGGKEVVVELLEPLPRGGWPCPRGYDEFKEFRTPPSTHVTYATTWFCLSAALALLTRTRIRQPVRSKARGM